VNLDAFVCLRKINAVIFRPIAIQLFSLTLDHAKPLRIKVVQILGQNLELCQQHKLQPFREGGYFRRAQFVEDDLEHGQKVKMVESITTLKRKCGKRGEQGAAFSSPPARPADRTSLNFGSNINVL